MITESIFRELGILLIRVDLTTDNAVSEYHHIGEPPSWAEDFLPSESKTIPLTDIFPFIESFIPDAIACWNDNAAEKCQSGVWTEVAASSVQYQLEAQALKTDNQYIIAITNLTPTYQLRQHVYQKAREIALANEKLKLQLNQRQRQLQTLIEKTISERQSEEELNDVVKGSASAVMICKPDGGVEIINQALMDIYSVSHENPLQHRSLLAQWLKEAESIHPEIHRVVDSGGYWEGEFESESNGESKWIRLAIGPVLDNDGGIEHLVCIANDMSELRKSNREIEKLTDYDLTTQLPNRRHFWKQLTKHLDNCIRHKSSFALIYIDIDQFKRINEGLGHHGGDFLLATLASRLSRSVKRDDFIAHLGGDEFALIINMAREDIDLGKIAYRLMEKINKPTLIEEQNVSVSASVGIAIHPRDGRDATSLMKNADLAMYHAKEMGRNQFQLYAPHLGQHFMGRLKVENLLRQAINQGQFRLEYQPQICTGKNPYLRMEALIRWDHPEEGVIPPGQFIPIAEENGLIIDIGRWVLETACRQAKEYADTGLDLVMSVNVSAFQLKDIHFPATVIEVLSEIGLPAKYLELEITETTVMQDLDKVINILRELKKHGISIALDDFGSGFSSLNYLKNLPVDNLKLDRSFIHELPYSDEGKTITASLIKLAHDLNMKVIAEGVENNQQLDLLLEQGCDYIQGYFFYYPLDPQKIRDILTMLKAQPNYSWIESVSTTTLANKRQN